MKESPAGVLRVEGILLHTYSGEYAREWAAFVSGFSNRSVEAQNAQRS